MNNRKLKQLVKEALSNMIDEVDVDDLSNKNYGEAMSETEGIPDHNFKNQTGKTTARDFKNKATDISDDYNDITSVGLEEMNMDIEDPDADDLADQIIMMSDTGLEEETLSLHEFFDLDEMARKAQSYKLTDRLTNAGSFLQRVNDKIKAKTMGAGGRGRKAKEFTEEDISNMLDVLGQGTFTSQDIVSAIGRFDKVQPVNAILSKMREKGYIDYDEDLKKSMEPDTSAEPKRRGRPAAPKPPSPEDEFDAPEMAPELAPDDDPVVQQATQAQAQAQDPKKQKVQKFMDQMKAMGVISDTNKVLDMDTYKDEFAKFKSTMSENTENSTQIEADVEKWLDGYLKGTILTSKDDFEKYGSQDDPKKVKYVVDGGFKTGMLDVKYSYNKEGIHIPLKDIQDLAKKIGVKDSDSYKVEDAVKNALKKKDFKQKLGFSYNQTDLKVGEMMGQFFHNPNQKPTNESKSLNENKNRPMKKGLLQERFQQLAGIKPLYAINSLNEKYENNEDSVSTDEVLKVLKPVVVKLGDAPLGKALQYFMTSLKPSETSMKDGYDKGGSQLQSMLTKLKDEDYEASQQFQREIGAAFDVAADIK